VPTPFDVSGTIAPRIALVILVALVAGLVLAFTRVSVIGYILLAVAAALYFLEGLVSLARRHK
jgi:hypothetical protein